jgi:hypothetical protein
MKTGMIIQSITLFLLILSPLTACSDDSSSHITSFVSDYITVLGMLKPAVDGVERYTGLTSRSTHADAEALKEALVDLNEKLLSASESVKPYTGSPEIPVDGMARSCYTSFKKFVNRNEEEIIVLSGSNPDEAIYASAAMRIHSNMSTVNEQLLHVSQGLVDLLRDRGSVFSDDERRIFAGRLKTDFGSQLERGLLEGIYFENAAVPLHAYLSSLSTR